MAGLKRFADSIRGDRHGERFDAVITDLGMPDMDGRRVARGVKRMCPDIPVILLTGWTQRSVEKDEQYPEMDSPLGTDRVQGFQLRALNKKNAAVPVLSSAVHVSPGVSRWRLRRFSRELLATAAGEPAAEIEDGLKVSEPMESGQQVKRTLHRANDLYKRPCSRCETPDARAGEGSADRTEEGSDL